MHFAFFVFVTLDTTREENVININMLVLRAIKTNIFFNRFYAS
jgi:hypothetical protein